MLVVDTSVAIAWGFEDEANAFTEAVLDRVRDAGAMVPAVWPYEMANTMVVGERRGRVTQADTARFLGVLGGLPVEVDDEAWAVVVPPIMGLARQESLSAYDASYLELALRRGLPLATQDSRLRAAADRIGVALVTEDA
jgi:predicted nucleic acid-binding protein